MAMFDTCLSAVRSAAQAKNLQVEAYIKIGMPDYLMGDESRLRQIIINLLGNAVKFTPHGSVRLEASWLNDRLTVDVIDTGQGIPEEMHEAIFDRFRQVSEGMTRSSQGSGLGLSISRDIAALFDGSVELVTPQPEIGAHFRFEARLSAYDASQDTPHTSTHARSFDLSGYKILIVEDNTVNRNVLTSYLAAANAETYEAKDGKSALQLIQEGTQFDAIIMDLHMPQMSGIDVLHALDAEFPDISKTLPVIMVTADVTPAAREALLTAGARSVLTKPFDLDALALETRSAIHQAAE